MIPKQENLKVYSNSSNEKGFTINASREAFRILSSGLYSNKIQAIVRELSCNAYDSHVMAGTPDRQFKIHLPDAWEPFFSVEDFGIGLDDDDINNIYTSYFTSTKTSSNDVIGGLGLGSKTPFSYTDTFTIRARRDAVERVYSAYISDAGSPTVSLMSEEDTDEPNGVLVSIPVKDQDFYSFQQEARNVFKYFRVVPEFDNSNMIVDNSIVEQLDEANGLIIHTNRYNSGTILAVMGNVAYSFKATDTIVPSSYTRVWTFLKETSMTIRFNIGDLSVAANRETLSFDEESKEVFLNKLQEISEGFYQATQDKIDNTCTNIFEAIRVVQNEVGAWGYGVFTFDGQSIDALTERNVLEDINNVYDPNGDLDDTTFVYSLRYERMLKHRLVERNSWSGDRQFERVSYAKAENDKIAFLFVMDDSEHHRGLDNNTRQKLRLHRGYALALHKLLTEEEQEEISKILQGRKVTFVTLQELKEEFKIIRDSQKEEDGTPKVRKIPVARVKKKEVRIRFWENKKEFDTPTKIDTLESRVVDVEEIKDKKIGFLTTSRGSMGLVLGNYVEEDIANIIYITKMFGLDGLVIATESKKNYLFEKMPFMIDVSDLEKKHIKDNELCFGNAISSSFGISFSKMSKELENGDIENLIYGSLFDHNTLPYNMRYDSEATFIKHYAKFKKKDLGVEVDQIMIKLINLLNTFTPTELLSFGDISGIFSSGHINPTSILWNNLRKQKSQETFDRSKQFLDKYPLVRHLVDSLYDNTVLEELKKYVNMIDLMEEEEEQNCSLYLEVA